LPDERPLPATLQALVEGLTPHHGATGSSPDLRPPEQIQPRQNGAAAPIVALENVRFSYPSGVEALRGVSLTIGLGERVAFLGPNGAGKSTLVRHLNGLLRPGAGQAHVAGQSTQKKSVAWCARHVSIVFQDVRNQLFARTVRDELRFGPRNLGKTEAEIDALVARSLALLDLEHVADEHPYDLPPPRRRLVAVAAALAMDAELLVLDEPTAGLDQAGIRLLERVIHEQAQAQRSIVVVSHDLDFCFETLERMVLVRSGQIVLDSPAAALDPQERAELEQTVGLPTGMRATQLLGLQDGHPLSRLLIPDPAPLVP
jgi:energy-coupling factor transporter ATP-binding protein EcfA2